MPEYQKECRTCGKRFHTKRESAKYCSSTCYHKYRKENRIIRKCPICNMGFFACETSSKKYCGKICAAIGQRTGDWHPCSFCGEAFWRPPSRQRGHHEQNYCSETCRRLASRKGKYINCENCGKKVWKYPSMPRKYCSQKCSREKRSSDHRKKILSQGPVWKEDHNGYYVSQFPGHPLANNHGSIRRSWYSFYNSHNKADWVLQAKSLGATLHHKNGRHNDNPKYLELRWPGKHPVGLNNQDMIDILEMQGYEIRMEQIR